MNKTFLSVADMALETGESESVFRKRLLRRELPVVKLGRNVRVKREDFSLWVERRIIPARQDSGRKRERGRGKS